MKNPQNAPHYILPFSHQVMVQWAPLLEDLRREYPADDYQADVPYNQMREDISQVLHDIYDQLKPKDFLIR
ncbi:hypothetical protein SAMN04488505_11279 [Chitinophaga rupis]|uniref:Uncharacterized protein n=1 Tax=Chitinophaga rupis TaxID=573321 RepID=A0A1H8ITF0_9BACT|nr:hypothetical protein [Chitinophaga rupis]SEN71913.1 hypothetical protein SAMN04488505_11279 [Chitinophaga rupis]